MFIFFTVLSLIPFYLIGTFPTGYLIAKRSGIDISKEGSGNVGATNVGRVLGKKAGIITLVGDLLKGFIAVTIGGFVGGPEWYPALVAVAVVFGHCFSLPPYLKGGKGVATSLGALLGLAPLVALSAVLVFALIYLWKKIVSVASIAAAVSAPIFAFFCKTPDSTPVALIVITMVIIYRHREKYR